jgi:hypothetical protein
MNGSCYFFFDDFLLLLLLELDFFDEDLLPPFFAAIRAHHLSCRTGPPGRASGHHAAGSRRQTFNRVDEGEGVRGRGLMTFDSRCESVAFPGDHHLLNEK